MSDNTKKENDSKELNTTNVNNESHKLFSEDVLERQKKQRRLAVVWPILSFILHLIGFILLVIFTPLRELVIPEKPENPPSQLSQMSKEEIEDMSEDVEEHRENEIAKYLEELQTVLHNMEYMKNELLKDYDEAAEQMAEEVKPEIQELFEAVLEQQEISLEHQENSEDFIEEIVDEQELVVDQATTQEALKDMYENEEDFKKAEQAQAIAQNLLDVIAAKAEITGMKETAKAAETAYKTQQEVNALQAETKQLLWDMRRDDEQLNDTYEEMKKEQEKYNNEYKPQKEQAEKNLEEKKAAKEEASQELKQAEQDKQNAEKQRNEANQKANNANNELNKARNERSQAEQQVRNEENNAKHKERDLNAAKDRTAKAERELEAAKKSEEQKQQKSDQAKQELAQAEQQKQEAEKNKDANPNALRDANNKLNNAQRNADNANNELKRAQEWTKNRENELSNAKKSEEQRAEQYQQAQEKTADAKQNLEAKKEQLSAAEQAQKQAQAERNQAESTLRQENNDLNNARQKDRNAQIALSNAERDLNHKKNREEKSKEYSKQLEEKRDSFMKAAKEKAKQLDEKDHKASEAQKALMETVKQIAKMASNELAKPEQLADETMDSPELANMNLSFMSLSDAYEKAKELEQQIAEKSRDIKATELAISQEMPLSQAIEMTDVAKTLRPDFDKSILSSQPTTEKEFIEKREEMTKVVREAENISNVAKSIMAEAETMVFPERFSGNYSSGHGASREDRLSRMYEISEIQNEIQAAGTEDSSQQAKDLASLMAEADARLAEQNGNGTSSSSSSMSSSSSSSSSSSMSSQQAQAGSSSSSASGRNPYARSGGRSSNAGSSKWIPQKLRAEDHSGVKGPTAHAIRGGSAEGMGVPSLSRGMEGLVSGNFIGSTGIPAKWARIVDWYIIGPFPNPNRVNLTRKFAPESKVDLDATYIGKDGKMLQWEYYSYQLRGEEIRPFSQDQYGIWYAYTEIFMEEECDVWMAVGSDDRMDIWVNDFKVWSSTNELKYWRINEGFRKVHLRKGRNRVLTRVENGWYVISWSMFIALPEAVQQ